MGNFIENCIKIQIAHISIVLAKDKLFSQIVLSNSHHKKFEIICFNFFLVKIFYKGLTEIINKILIIVV